MEANDLVEEKITSQCVPHTKLLKGLRNFYGAFAFKVPIYCNCMKKHMKTADSSGVNSCSHIGHEVHLEKLHMTFLSA